MKKLLYLILCLFGLTAAFVSCSDDDEEGVTFTETPEVSAQGVYQGTFIRVAKGTTDTTRAEGVLTITPADTAYKADVKMECTDFKVNVEVPVNISHANNGFTFSNTSATNSLKSSIIGVIDESGNVETRFTLSQISGRKTAQYEYKFIGSTLH